MSSLQEKRILVVDDDLELVQLLELILAQAGARVHAAADGQEALRQFHAHQPHLVLLDLMMPNVDGWQVCRHIRELSEVPIVILTCREGDDDVIRGLDCGADDYVTKPVRPDVLLARVRAALRRAPEQETLNGYSDGYLTIDLDQRRVSVRGEPVSLSGIEHRLLTYLLQNAGRMVSTEQILEVVWGEGYQDRPEYVHAYIWRLRQKLEADPKHPSYLVSERGVGYCFEKQPSR